jgi:hypothetical protein
MGGPNEAKSGVTMIFVSNARAGMGTKEAHALSSPCEHWRFEGTLDAVSE